MKRIKKMGKTLAVAVLLLVTLWGLFVLLLTQTARIPRAAIAPNMDHVAEYYREKDMFERWNPKNDTAIIHNYADAILMNLIWNTNPEKPFSSVMTAPIYQAADATQGEALAATVLEGASANANYARYWHGTSLFLRPLLCVTDLDGIRVFQIVLLSLVGLVYFALLLWRKLYAIAAGSALGLLLCYGWIVPLCIEYMSCFVLMFLLSSAVLLWQKESGEPLYLFVAAGALVCFFDFLTCETLTLFVPLLCLLWLRFAGKQNAFRPALSLTLRCSVAWALSYALTWLCKWCIAAQVMDCSIADVARSGLTRAAGGITIGEQTLTLGQQMVAAVAVNLGRIFPFSLAEHQNSILLILALMALLLFCIWFLYRKAVSDRGVAGVFWLIALTPPLRFALLSNHSGLHPFFTFRALLISVIALFAALALTIERPQKKGRRKWR